MIHQFNLLRDPAEDPVELPLQDCFAAVNSRPIKIAFDLKQPDAALIHQGNFVQTLFDEADSPHHRRLEHHHHFQEVCLPSQTSEATLFDTSLSILRGCRGT